MARLVWLALAVGCSNAPPCGELVAPSVAAGPGGGGNVLIVLIDDVGVDQLAAYGQPGPMPRTPTVDCLCERGMRFEHAWATPLCSPSRAALLTGRSAEKTGLGTNVEAHEQLSRDEVTLAELAHGSGMETGFVGKWHLDGWDAPGALRAPLLQGFDSAVGLMGNPSGPSTPDPLLEDDKPDYFGYWRIDNGDVRWSTRYATTAQIDDALHFVRHADGPWLLYLALTAAHVPLHDPPNHLLAEPLPRDASDPERFRAVVEAADTELGRLLRGMDPQVLADTTVIFVGDNGTSPEGISSAGDPDRVKGTLFEGGVHVPLVVTGPQVPAPGVSQSLVHLVDILPTVAEIAGGEDADDGLVALDLDGVSFLHALSGDDAGSADYVATMFSPKALGLDTAVRDHRYKLAHWHGGREALYDLEADPDESYDLLRDDVLDDRAAEALQGLRTALADSRGVPRFAPPVPEQ